MNLNMEKGNDYSSPSYWNKRYETEEHYEWLGQGCYAAILDMISKEIPDKGAKILVAGCGNSNLSQDLYQIGFKSITSCDISDVCIQRQKAKTKDNPDLTWTVADLTNLQPFEDQEFDVVIEKATLDSFLANESSQWTPSEDKVAMVDQSVASISRVLKKSGGKFISVTFAQPHFRLRFYAKEAFDWDVTFDVINKADLFHFYSYVMVKGQALDWTLVQKYTKLGCQRDESESLQEQSDDDQEYLKNMIL